ncbi:MAG: DUF1326 domain-containing protein [Chloroflexi bacterium]|nr:DUF1326 domain-containing protein [Chloroflexota bacterium]
MSTYLPWNVSGSYFEACNCEAICPCRIQNGRPGNPSTYGVCDFALSWLIKEGRAADINLSGFGVVLAAWYSEAEPGTPWRATLYVDEQANSAQRDALAAIFLGRAGGTTRQNFAGAIAEVHAVRPAHIALDHTPGRRSIKAGAWVTVREEAVVDASGAVACGIPGYDHPGHELRASLLKVDDAPLCWEFNGRAAFATDFAYRSDK